MTMSALHTNAKLFHTKGSMMLRTGMPRKSTFSASFSSAVHCEQTRDGPGSALGHADQSTRGRRPDARYGISGPHVQG